MSFVDGQRHRIDLPGEVNVENALVATAVAVRFWDAAAKVAERLAAVPGMPPLLSGITRPAVRGPVGLRRRAGPLQKLTTSFPRIRRDGSSMFGSCGGGRARRLVLRAMAAGAC